jgi:hypothetical protein
MPKAKQGKFAEFEGMAPLLVLGIPLLVLLGTAFLHWTMQVFLEPNLLMRLVKLVGLPFYILAVVVGPPLLIAWSVSFLYRRSETFFGIVFIVLLLVWGFWYMIPPIVENWEWFMRFVDEFGAV